MTPRLSIILLTAGLTATVFAEKVHTPLAASAETIQPLTEVNDIPDVAVKTVDDEIVSIRKEIAGQPAVLIFYRGGWCPYCNTHLAELQKAHKDLVAMGYKVLAISPDDPKSLKPTGSKNELDYTLLSDEDMEASGAFGLAFQLDDETVRKYREYGIKLHAKQDGKFWLPVPAVYIVDRNGKIAFSHTNPDYKQRLPIEELMKAAREALN